MNTCRCIEKEYNGTRMMGQNNNIVKERENHHKRKGHYRKKEIYKERINNRMKERMTERYF